ncbi:metal-dependent transcriptional regulator [Niabella terrae]
MASYTEENYLKALYALVEENGRVTVNELSKRLAIKMPTVTSMMKKLAAQGLVMYESYKPVRLTVEGKRQAALIIRKHRLTEMFLVEKMGFGWEQVHEIAEQIEHIQSPAFFERMDALLGHPGIDPHGSPIPDKKGRILRKSYLRLSDCKPGDRVRLAAVVHTSQDFLIYLNQHELQLGERLKIKSIEAFDGSMVVSYTQHPATQLSAQVCDRLLVEK